MATACRDRGDAVLAEKLAINLHWRLDKALLKRLERVDPQAKTPVLGVSEHPELAFFREHQRVVEIGRHYAHGRAKNLFPPHPRGVPVSIEAAEAQLR